MRKLFALLLVLALLPVVPARAAKDEITVYNWGQYISDGTDGSLDVIAAFEEATGIHVNYLTYDSNESLYTKLKTGGASYDVIIPSDYMIGRLIEEDMLEPLNFDNIPNYQYVDEAFRNTAYDPENRYSVPYTWGTVGVIYNSKFVDEADAGSWDLLWNSKYAGKILMFDNNRDAFAIAESLLGYSLNTTDEASLRQCAQKLVEQKPILQGHVMDQIYAKMEREEAWIAPYYAGDYLYMVEENPALEFYFPEEGFNIFHRRHVHSQGRCQPGGRRGLYQLPLLAGDLRAEPGVFGLLLSPLGGQGLYGSGIGRKSHRLPQRRDFGKG